MLLNAHKESLTDVENQMIDSDLAEVLIHLDLSEELGREKRILVSFVKKPHAMPRNDKVTRRSISSRICVKYSDSSTGNQIVSQCLQFC